MRERHRRRALRSLRWRVFAGGMFDPVQARPIRSCMRPVDQRRLVRPGRRRGGPVRGSCNLTTASGNLTAGVGGRGHSSSEYSTGLGVQSGSGRGVATALGVAAERREQDRRGRGP